MADDKVSQTQQSLRQEQVCPGAWLTSVPWPQTPLEELLTDLTQGEARTGLASLGHGYSLGFRAVQ